MITLLERPSLPMPHGASIAAADLFESCTTKADIGFGAPTAEQPFGDAPGVRLQFEPDVGGGRVEAVTIGERMMLTVHDRRFSNSFAHLVGVGGWISAHFRISGSSTQIFGELGQVRRNARSCAVIAHPEGVLNAEWFDEDTELKSVALALHPDFLVEDLGMSPEQLPDPLRAWVGGDREHLHHFELRFTGAMHQAAADLIDNPYRGRLRHRHAEARALQLACIVADGLARREVEETVAVRLTALERQRLSDIRELLSVSYCEPRTVAELARRAGMNRTKLQYGFRQLFGRTLFDYRNEVRMIRAHELLREGAMTISQVAQGVGYEHANNFTAAFKRRFGVLPREERRARSSTH